MSSAVKEATLERLCHAVQALALPSEKQLRLFPEYAVTGDELVNDFDNFYQAASGSRWWPTVEAPTRESLEALAAEIESLIEQYDDTIWSDDAITNHECWARFRILAQAALRSSGWPQQHPPSYRHEFVRAGSKSAV